MMTSLQIDSSDKIAIFSDIHFGISKDSEIKLKISVKYIDWLINYCKTNKINTLLFLGDWFNNRNSISVLTSNIAYKCVKKISKAGLKLYFVIGNHDLYYKETEDNINSLEQYTEISNIHIINDITELNFINQDKNALFISWDQINKKPNKKFDYCFGHFDFDGAYMTGNYVCKNSVDPSSYLSLSNIVFVGHFHINGTYKYQNGNIHCVGSPFELDWGDYGNQKYLTVLDLKTNEIEHINNDFSPIHVKVYWSKFKEKLEKLDNIKNNYVKFIIDAEYDFKKITKILAAINSLKPLKPCECEFIYNTKFENPLKELPKVETQIENKHLSILDYFESFFILQKDKISNLDSNKLKVLVEQYFEQASNETTNFE